MASQDITGWTFNSWLVLSYSHTKGNHFKVWNVQCLKCKREYKRDGQAIYDGKSKACIACTRKRKLTIEEIVALRAAGNTLKTIADAAGVTVPRVWKILKDGK